MIPRSEYGIVINPDLLSEDHLPEEIPGREAQITELSFCLKPALSKRKPMHSWLHGKPGSGKTATSKYVLRKLYQETGIKGCYVNCWEKNSLHFVMSQVMQDLRILHTDQSNTPIKLEKFQKFLKGEPFILVLDEIDQVPPKEQNTIIYSLTTLGNLGLILISSSRATMLDLEDRVKSRLNPETIEFRPYSATDLMSILKRRAECSLMTGSWNNITLEKIAELANGDARVAIQTMRTAAHNADNENYTSIKTSHIMSAWKKAMQSKRSYQLRSLTNDHRMLYDIIKLNAGIQSDQLWQDYLDKTREVNCQPIANRTFSKYCARLRDMGLIRIEPAKVKEGNVRRFSVVD